MAIPAAAMRRLYRQMPDKCSIVFRRRTAVTPTYTDYTVTNCWYRPDPTREGQVSRGVYLKRFRRWYMPLEMTDAAGFTSDPAPGDLVVNTATSIDPVAGSWTVLTQSQVGALGCWELASVLLEIRSSLAVTVTVQRRSNVQDATGRILPTTTTAETVSGWLQAEGSEANEALLGKLQMPTRGTIYLASYVSGLLATDTLAVSGTNYNVVSMEDPLSLEDLQAVTVELAR